MVHDLHSGMKGGQVKPVFMRVSSQTEGPSARSFEDTTRSTALPPESQVTVLDNHGSAKQLHCVATLTLCNRALLG